MKYILKISLIKSLLSNALFLLLYSLVNAGWVIFAKLYELDYRRPHKYTIIFISVIVVVYLVMTASTLIIKSIKKIVAFPDKLRLRTIIYISLTFIISTLLIFFMFLIYDPVVHSRTNMYMVVGSFILSILFFIISVVFILFVYGGEQNIIELEQQKFYNRSLFNIIDGVRAMKHGYDNTFATMMGYVEMNDIDGLKNFINENIAHINNIDFTNNYSMLKIKNPGLLGLMFSKVNKMENSEIKFKIVVNNEIDEISMEIRDLCECIGILLDNAIEAVNNTDYRNVDIVFSNVNNIINIKIKNSINKKPVISKMFDKGWSTKGEGRGLGLWILNNVLKKYRNVILNTSIDDKFVTQELIID